MDNLARFLLIGNMWKSGSETSDECNIRDSLKDYGYGVTDYNKFDIEKVFEDKPKVDVTLIWKGGEFTSDMIARLRELNPGKPIYYIQHDLMEANIHTDATMEQRNPTSLPTQHFQQARNCDAYFSKELGWRKQYEDAGVNFIYWPEDACPNFYDEPVKDENYERRCEILGLTRDCDVILTATWRDMGIDRAKYLEPLRDSGLDFTVFSLNPDAWQDRGYKAQSGAWDENNCLIISKAKINIALDWRHDVEGYWSDRIFQIMGAGGFVLAKYTLGMERAFGGDEENLVYW